MITHWTFAGDLHLIIMLFFTKMKHGHIIPLLGVQQSQLLELTISAAASKLLQSCPTLCDPLDDSPLGSSVRRILQARILEWVCFSLSLIHTHTHTHTHTRTCNIQTH